MDLCPVNRNRYGVLLRHKANFVFGSPRSGFGKQRHVVNHLRVFLIDKGMHELIDVEMFTV
jgi:hypothetical protein